MRGDDRLFVRIGPTKATPLPLPRVFLWLFTGRTAALPRALIMHCHPSVSPLQLQPMTHSSLEEPQTHSSAAASAGLEILFPFSRGYGPLGSAGVLATKENKTPPPARVLLYSFILIL
ncbi:hypothetical protein Dimus_015366 [Dionaea muscipula]